MEKIYAKVLIAPLDWGLGHATRCIPIIRHLQKAGCEITVTGDDNLLKLLKKEFLLRNYIPLPGYRIHYSKNKRFFLLKILLQIPKIINRIKYEHKWLDMIISAKGFDIVISDNRYGFYTKRIPCIFITHQLQIAAPFDWLEKRLRKHTYKYINRFTECWIPDLEEAENIAGKLSHPFSMPSIPTKYIGILSRFEKKYEKEKKYDWMVVLSGPEPQKSILEKKMLKIIHNLKGTVLLVRGKLSSDKEIDVPGNCIINDYLATKEMQEAYEASEFIISRSGYTTVMEILSLQKKSILIPTPGQTEQEYLAAHLMKQHWCYSFEQEEEILPNIEKATAFPYDLPQLPENILEQTIDDLIKPFRDNPKRGKFF